MKEGLCQMRGPDGRDVIAPRAGSGGRCAPPNKRMHATRDTSNVIYNRRCGRARDARRSAASG
jgi:hypothetical protein